MFLETSMFIKPLISAAILIAIVAPSQAASGFSVVVDEAAAHIDVSLDGARIARYMHAYDPRTEETLHDTYKPYLHIYDASGERLITKGPGGRYTHHRGIFVGFQELKHVEEDGKEKGYDRWHMRDGAIVQTAIVEATGGADSATIRVANDWMNKDAAPFGREERTMTFTRAPDELGRFMVDLRSVLTPLSGSIEITPNQDQKGKGDAEHNGLQFRAADDIKNKVTSYLLPVEDKVSADGTSNVDLNWAVLRYELESDPDATGHVIWCMSHPKNPTGALWSVYRDYGRFGTAPSGTATMDAPLDLGARFIVASGELPSREAAAAAYASYAEGAAR